MARRGIIGAVEDLTEHELAAVRRRLDEERERTAARAAALARDLEEIITASADAVRDDEHDPEGATIAFERAQVAALLAGAREQRSRLEQAARRLQEPGAGRCAGCGTPIGFERLRARPAATACVRCAGAGGGGAGGAASGGRRAGQAASGGATSTTSASAQT